MSAFAGRLGSLALRFGRDLFRRELGLFAPARGLGDFLGLKLRRLALGLRGFVLGRSLGLVAAARVLLVFLGFQLGSLAIRRCGRILGWLGPARSLGRFLRLQLGRLALGLRGFVLGRSFDVIAAACVLLVFPWLSAWQPCARPLRPHLPARIGLLAPARRLLPLPWPAAWPPCARPLRLRPWAWPRPCRRGVRSSCLPWLSACSLARGRCGRIFRAGIGLLAPARSFCRFLGLQLGRLAPPLLRLRPWAQPRPCRRAAHSSCLPWLSAWQPCARPLRPHLPASRRSSWRGARLWPRPWPFVFCALRCALAAASSGAASGVLSLRASLALAVSSFGFALLRCDFFSSLAFCFAALRAAFSASASGSGRSLRRFGFAARRLGGFLGLQLCRLAFGLRRFVLRSRFAARRGGLCRRPGLQLCGLSLGLFPRPKSSERRRLRPPDVMLFAAAFRLGFSACGSFASRRHPALLFYRGLVRPLGGLELLVARDLA